MTEESAAETERKRERERDKQTDRQTDRDRDRDRETDRETDRDRDRHRQRQTETDRDRDRQTERKKEYNCKLSRCPHHAPSGNTSSSSLVFVWPIIVLFFSLSVGTRNFLGGDFSLLFQGKHPEFQKVPCIRLVCFSGYLISASSSACRVCGSYQGPN